MSSRFPLRRTGLALALFYTRKVKTDPGAQRWIRHGVNWYAFSTMVQMALGLWFLSALPEPVKHRRRQRADAGQKLIRHLADLVLAHRVQLGRKRGFIQSPRKPFGR